jgi:carbonic anhydrase
LIAAGLPRKSTSPAVIVKRLDIEDAFTDTSSYYAYGGSLTTPPCSPVSWIVLKKFAQVSPRQFEAFRSILGNNFRPLQAPNGRVIRTTVRRDDDRSDEAASGQDGSSDQ